MIRPGVCIAEEEAPISDKLGRQQKRLEAKFSTAAGRGTDVFVPSS